MRTQTWAAGLAAVVVLAGCGAAGPVPASPGAPGRGTASPTSTVDAAATTVNPGPSSPSATPRPGDAGHGSPAVRRVTALDVPALQAYLREVDGMDAALRQVATLVNGDLTARGLAARPRTVAAVRALTARETRVRRSLPAGMSPALTRAALLVYSELSSRVAAFNPIVRASADLPAGDPEFTELKGCLANGAVAAARSGRDLTALRRLAASSRAFVPAAPSARATAEIALRTTLVRNGNGCCDSCGGYLSDALVPLVWGRPAGPREPGERVDGTIDGIDFDATYHADGGWTVQIHAG